MRQNTLTMDDIARRVMDWAGHFDAFCGVDNKGCPFVGLYSNTLKRCDLCRVMFPGTDSCPCYTLTPKYVYDVVTEMLRTNNFRVPYRVMTKFYKSEYVMHI